MMIDKRLIGMMGDSKRYIAKNVALQWLALAANVAMIFAVSRYLGALYDQLTIGDTMAGAPNLPLTLGIVAAALLNAMKLTGREMGTAHIVINGAGAAGIAIAKLLLQMNFGDIVLCDKQGAIYRGAEWTNPAQKEMAELTNRENKQGTLADMLKGADV